MSDLTESEFTGHQPCEDCGSSNGSALYDDGHTYCFVCKAHKAGDGEYTPAPKSGKKHDLIPPGSYRSLPSRNLTEEACKKYGYSISSMYDKPVQVANYRRDGQVVAQKVRGKDKSFHFLGDAKNCGLYGQHMFGGGGKRLMITEGEIDAISLSQAFGLRWPAVSVPNGAQGATKSIAKELEWVSSYDEIVLVFDMDAPGQDAAKDVARMLPPGKVRIASLPLKDASEMIQAGRAKELTTCVYEATPYRPDGLVTIDDILEEIRTPTEIGMPWFLPSLTEMTYGRRLGEIYGFGAGTGIGKTDLFTQQMSYDIDILGKNIGVIMLEQRPVETGKRLAGKMEGKRFHIPDAGHTSEDMETAIGKMRGKVHFYDNFGQTDWDVVKTHIRYLAVTAGIKLFYLDHLTAMADTTREKESIEQITKEMSGLANELQIIIHFVSHLSTPRDGKPHEEGGRVMIGHFKGSRSIGFWSHSMFGLERDQQHKDVAWRSITTLRVLKDRYAGGSTGQLIYLGYNPETGILFETDPPPEEDEATSYGFSDTNSDY